MACVFGRGTLGPPIWVQWIASIPFIWKKDSRTGDRFLSIINFMPLVEQEFPFLQSAGPLRITPVKYPLFRGRDTVGVVLQLSSGRD
jgi:hypothetical protein